MAKKINVSEDCTGLALVTREGGKRVRRVFPIVGKNKEERLISVDRVQSESRDIWMKPDVDYLMTTWVRKQGTKK